MKNIFNIAKTILFFLIILFVIFFSIVNSEIVKINFDFFPFNFILEIRLFLLIIFCFCLGFICGIATTSYKLVGKYFENLGEKRKVQKLERDLKKIEEKQDENE